ncbi:MAG TPA: response regulator, partial [Gemmata sp.]
SQTVFVVDDDPLIRESLSRLLGSVRLSVQAFENGELFLEQVGVERPGCAIIELRMPGLSGLAVLDRLKARELSPPVILLTKHGTVPIAARAMRAGAVHVLVKPYSDQEVLDTVQEALERDAQHRADHARSAAVRARLNGLTARERQILDRVLAGQANKVVASELRVTVKNVEFHRASMMKKLEVSNLVELMRLVLTLPPRDRCGHCSSRLVGSITTPSHPGQRTRRGARPPGPLS